jgi:hypothetical protein
MEEIAKVAEIALPLKHQFGKLIAGTIAGFAASKLAEKAYEAAYKALQNRKTAASQ